MSLISHRLLKKKLQLKLEDFFACISCPVNLVERQIKVYASKQLSITRIGY